MGLKELAGARWALGVLGVIGSLTAGCQSLPADRESIPATAIRFRNVAREAGLRFQWGHGKKSPLTSLETFGCGCAFWDYDRDGWLDILLVGEPRCALFRNQGDGRFTDVTDLVGLDRFEGPWKGCAIGDIDGDGWSDLVVTGYHRTLVVRNRDGRQFEDVSAASGILNDGWGASAGFADLDRDGDLDLYICNYVVFGPEEQQYCELAPGVRSGCPPSAYIGEKGRLYRNDGSGRFTDISTESGVVETDGKGLVVGYCDYDGDGWIDFYVGNDGTSADLFRNVGGLKFQNRGIADGISLNSGNIALAAMGIDWGDVDRDGRLDAVVTAFSGEPFALFRNREDGLVDESGRAGIAAPTLKPLGFGTRFADFDNDGWLDVIFACGHVYDNTNLIDPSTVYRQPLMVFQNAGGWKYVQSLKATDVGEILGRGLASGDYDRDGRVDVLVVDYGGEPLLLRNETETRNHWLSVAATGPAGNPLGYGCRVEARIGGETRLFQLSPVASYLSSSEPVVHIGLRPSERVSWIRVTWPDGRALTLESPRANTRVVARWEDAALQARARPYKPSAGPRASADPGLLSIAAPPSLRWRQPTLVERRRETSLVRLSLR